MSDQTKTTPTGDAMIERLQILDQYFIDHHAFAALMALEDVKQLAKSGNPISRGFVLTLCQVFDAGRNFQKQHPDRELLPFPLK